MDSSFDYKKAEKIVEAVLFAAGGSTKVQDIARILGIDSEIALRIARNLADRLDETGSGVEIAILGDSVQMVTRAEFVWYVREILGRNASKTRGLSRAAMEILAVIAYKQPVTRGYIEQVRGVDSSYTIGLLLEKGLICEAGRLDAPGRPLLFTTTTEFLRVFGITSPEELPPIGGEYEIHEAEDGTDKSGGIEPAAKDTAGSLTEDSQG